MNKRMIIYILGRMLGVEGAVLLIPAFVSLLYQEESGFSFLIVSLILGVVFLIFGRKRPKSTRIYGKESFAIVALAWLLWSAFGALPFVISGSIPAYIDAFFETVSGFTTTGSTILQEIESLPMGINFWRCLTHWIGGMGVLVFVLMRTFLMTWPYLSKLQRHVLPLKAFAPDLLPRIPPFTVFPINDMWNFSHISPPFQRPISRPGVTFAIISSLSSAIPSSSRTDRNL